MLLTEIEMTTPEQRAELLALAEKATPRPWYPQHSDDRLCMSTYYIATEDIDDDPREIHGKVVAVTLYQSERCACHDAGRWEEDAAYIVAACNLAPALAREVEGLRKEVDRLKGLFDIADHARDTAVDAGSDLMAEIMRLKALAHFLATHIARNYNTDPRNAADPYGVDAEAVLQWAEEEMRKEQDAMRNEGDDE
ncbi:hypothetical protein LJC59_00060 [Desulfovibrio sp. OttesenSCG-928-A18]|nr:hypothetical protein [Desulfovibrio sp. OttesenSCG-928-A18]